ncbi:MAG: AmmeMemoRadiSam system protein A [gamma proteobacterium symbiont of Bathyaustriella thionipta]|nr:AmmeMemoRadiSam system protein A [gamma proteobacterium symbiont of Bathyaustriella thionipta]
MLQLARRSIEYALQHRHQAPDCVADSVPPELQAKRACFVTLHIQQRLRGCIGHLQAVQSLYCDIIENACSAAFRDPRFEPLAEKELPRLHIEIPDYP